MKNTYELGYWLKIDSNLTEDLERIKKILLENESEIIFEEKPQKRNLAYPVKKQKIGYFGYLIFKNDNGEKIISIKKNLLKINNILRFIIIKKKYLPLKEESIKKEEIIINES